MKKSLIHMQVFVVAFKMSYDQMQYKNKTCPILPADTLKSTNSSFFSLAKQMQMK